MADSVIHWPQKMISVCITCSTEFNIKPYQEGKRKYCSFKCYYPHRFGRTPPNKGKHYSILSARTGKIINCLICGKEKYFELNQLKKRPCLYCSVACARFADRKTELVYSSLHSRIRADWGKASICEDCGNKANIDWANLNGLYRMVRNEWKMLCRSCHIRRDRRVNRGAYLNFISLKR